MPLYDYKCDQCGEVFEVMQKFSDAPLMVHEGCGGSVHRLLSPPALQFKGSGWYITDYGKSGSKGGGSSANANGGGSSESKPADSSKSTEAKPSSSSSASESKGS